MNNESLYPENDVFAPNPGPTETVAVTVATPAPLTESLPLNATTSIEASVSEKTPTPSKEGEERTVEVEITEDEKNVYFKIVDGKFDVPPDFLIDSGIILDKEKVKQNKTLNPPLAFANGIVEMLAAKRYNLVSPYIENKSLQVERMTLNELTWLNYADHAIQCLGEARIGLDYVKLNTRKDAKWRSEFMTPSNKRIGILTSQMKGLTGDEILTGKRAMDILDGLTGLGRSIKVPLYHTGIFVVLRAPTVSAYVELHQMMVDEVIDIGRKSRGAIFSGDMSVLSERIIDVILGQVVSTNAASRDPAYLKSIIRTPDISALMWAAMAAAYPNGYEIGIACTHNDCMHVHNEIVDLRKLYWVDQNRLTSRQISLLERTYHRETLSDEDLVTYQEEFESLGLKRRYLIESYMEREEGDTSGVYAVFGMPTLAEYFSMTGEWINAIEHESARALGSNLRGESRNKYVNEQVKVTSLLRYGHFISKLEFEDGSGEVGTVIDRKDINDALVRLSGNAIAMSSFAFAINEYINHLVVSVVGIPNFPCPECGKAHATENSPSKHIIPLDVLGTFTTHYRELISQILEEK